MEGFSDQGPEGVPFEFEGKLYTIQPRIASGFVQRQARQMIAELERKDLIAILNAKPPLSESDRRTVIETTKGYGKTSFGDVARAHQIPEVLAVVLQHSCDEIESYEQALRIVDNFPSYLELQSKSLVAMGLDSLKNLKALSNPDRDNQESTGDNPSETQAN